MSFKTFSHFANPFRKLSQISIAIFWISLQIQRNLPVDIWPIIALKTFRVCIKIWCRMACNIWKFLHTPLSCGENKAHNQDYYTKMLFWIFRHCIFLFTSLKIWVCKHLSAILYCIFIHYLKILNHYLSRHQTFLIVVRLVWSMLNKF